MHEEIFRDHFLGGIYGLMIGNAIGTPFEDRSGGEIALRFGDKALDMMPDTRGRMAPGEWTDDGGLALVSMRSFTRCHGFEAEHVANELARYLRTKPKRLVPYTRGVLAEIDRDFENWASKGANQWYEGGGVHAGNGILAACTVPGFYYNQSLERMIDATIGYCQLTYFDPRCVEAALVINFALNQCLHKGSLESLGEKALAFLQALRRDGAVSDRVYEYDPMRIRPSGGASIHLPYSLERSAVDDALSSLASCGPHDLHNTRYVVASMQVALWSLVNTDNFVDCVSAAVRFGGNADVQGALAGALAGARHGLSNIPHEWIARVMDSGQIMTVGECLLSSSRETFEREFTEEGRHPVSALPPVI